MKQLVVSLAVLFALALHARADTFHFAIDDFPPFVDRQADGFGIGPRIVTAALASQSHQARYHFVPWPRAYRMAMEGQIDGTFPWTNQGDRHEQFLLSAPVFEHRFSLVFAPGQARPWQDFDDLDGLRFGTVAGYAIAIDFYQWIEQTGQSLEEVNSESLLFRMLAYNRFDVAAFDQLAARAYINALQDDVPLVTDLVIEDRAIETSNTVVLMPLGSERSQRLQAILAAGLAAIRADGTYDAIVSGD
ncbi:substrate-binding periplasmic protein [Saccharospirillum mangrovi]|uniref:substrate-binding periplasmic protein n=1 Tax=Saccharospirillum mangrovi TaxID=2161747 RepID=UPI000D3B610B|nr:transporter substrate-binding domain-containing protein [Saccharospirillum mangrovi]